MKMYSNYRKRAQVLKRKAVGIVIFTRACPGRPDQRPRWLFWKILAHFSLQK